MIRLLLSEFSLSGLKIRSEIVNNILNEGSRSFVDDESSTSTHTPISCDFMDRDFLQTIIVVHLNSINLKLGVELVLRHLLF